MPAPFASSARPRPWWADRSWLLLAAPLVGAAWLPWWSVLGLLLALAVTHREGEARSVRVPLLLLGGGLGLVLLLPGMRGAEGALAFMRAFLTVFSGTLLVYLGVSALEGRHFRPGAAWLGVLLLLGSVGPGGVTPPSLAVGVLALVLTLLGTPGAEEKGVLRLGGSGRAVVQVAGAALLGAVLVGLLALLTPGPVESAGTAPPPPPQVERERTAGESPGTPATSGEGQAPATSSRAAPVLQGPLPGAEYPLMGSLLLMAAVLFAAWRLREDGPWKRRRPRWWEVAAVLGLLVTAALVFAFGLASRAGEAGGLLPGTSGEGLGGAGEPGGSASGEDTLWGHLDQWFRALNLLTFAVLTLLAAAVFWLGLRARRSGRVEPPAGSPLETAAPAGGEALHRVRLAYRAALASLAGAGLGRRQAETPAEHAGRAARELPVLAGPLGLLVAAYAPVRYGGRVTDEDADAAERAAQEVTRLTVGVKVETPESETS